MKPTLVVFLGDLGGSSVEEMVGDARTAATIDSVETALASGAFAGAILATDNSSLHIDIPGVALDYNQSVFHFGRRLAELIRNNRLKSVVYMGGGSVPLFKEGNFAEIAGLLKEG